MLRRLAALLALAALAVLPAAGARRSHAVTLGASRRVPYSAQGDPAGNRAEEKELRIRPLLVDGQLREWTTGEGHDVTDRSFVIRRALRVNDSLPGDRAEHWVWQRGPWLLVDRSTGHVAALRLPDYDPAVSDVVWFRDYAAYCGLPAGGRSLYAVVAQVAARRPVLSHRLGAYAAEEHAGPACAPAVWQREPLRVSFAPAGGPPFSFDLVGASAQLVEENEEDAPAAASSR